MMKKILSLVTMSIILSACATSGGHIPVERWTKLTDQKIPLGTESDQLAQVVIVRQHDGVTGPAANVFVQDNYVTSLIPGSYQVINVCPQKQTFTTQFTSINNHPESKTTQVFDFKPGETMFLTMVEDSNHNVSLKPLQADLICPVFSNLKRQNYSVIRGNYNKNCMTTLRPAKIQLNNNQGISSLVPMEEINLYFGE